MSVAGAGIFVPSLFDGRKVLVTGAASGIGLAVSKMARAAGAALAMLDVEASVLQAEAAAIGGIPLTANLADGEATARVVLDAVDALEGLDAVINCAGVHVGGGLADLTTGDWDRAIAINLTAPFVVCRAALPALRARGGAIVNVASGAGLLPDTPGTCAYAASKGGLIAFTKALAADLAPGIRANAVCPGLTETPMVAHMLVADEVRAQAVSRYALKRAADPDEIARVILFLASDAASFVTGATWVADGGRTFH